MVLYNKLGIGVNNGIIGTCLICKAGRVRRAGPGAEPGARDISDQLPFLEYELHRLLLAKLRMQVYF